MNRIDAAIVRMRTQIEDRLAKGQTTQEALDAMHKALDMSFLEYVKFHELKSAMMDVVLTPEEAQTLYALLGNTPDHFNQQELAAKAVATQAFKELLDVTINRRTAV